MSIPSPTGGSESGSLAERESAAGSAVPAAAARGRGTTGKATETGPRVCCGRGGRALRLASPSTWIRCTHLRSVFGSTWNRCRGRPAPIESTSDQVPPMTGVDRAFGCWDLAGEMGPPTGYMSCVRPT